MAVPYTFATATSSIPLSQLDSNFATPITLGNTAVYLGGTYSTIGNLTLTNVTISSGNVTYGNANAVVYTNSSNVGVTSTALTFDGTNLGVGATLPAGSGRPNFNIGYAGTGLVGAQADLSIVSSAYYGGSWKRAEATYQPTRLNISDGIFVWQYASSGSIDSAISWTEQMRLTSTGLGIGTSSPANKLAIVGTGATRITITDNASTGIARLIASGTEAYVGNASATGSFIIQTNSSNIATFDVAGNLGLGVTPSAWGGTSKAMQIATGGFEGRSNAFAMNNNAYFNSGWKYVGSAGATLYNMSGSEHQWYNAASGTAGNAITFTQAMTLDASGRLGIGSTSPSRPLDISATASVDNTGATNKWTASFRDTTATALAGVGGGLLFQGLKSTGGSVGNFGAIAGLKENSTDGNENGTLVFYTTPNTTGLITERARIDSSGNFLVGTTSLLTGNPILNVKQTANAYLASFTHNVNADYVVLRMQSGYAQSAQNATMIQFVDTNGNERGSIKTSGTATLYNTTSDYRLKTVIGSVSGAGERLDALKPIDYKWTESNQNARGFLAHEFQTVYPNSVTGDKDAVDEQGNPKYQSMQAATSEVIADLVAEIQSLRKRLADAGI